MKDPNLLDSAKALAEKFHSGQFRKARKRKAPLPYIKHPYEVVARLQSWGINDSVTLSVAYCHDLLEDTNATPKEIENATSKEVLTQIQLLTREEGCNNTEYIRRIAFSGSVPALMVKAADRICNTLDFIEFKGTEYADRYFKYALEIFAVINLLCRERSFFKKYQADLNYLSQRGIYNYNLYLKNCSPLDCAIIIHNWRLLNYLIDQGAEIDKAENSQVILKYLKKK